MLNSINPATDELIHSYEEMSQEKVDDILMSGQHVFLNEWRKSGFAERQKLMANLSALLEKNKETLALLVAREMGKPIESGLLEIKKCAWACEYFGENAEKFLRPVPTPSDAKKSYVAFKPLGLILGIMPWNYPFWQVFRFAIPTLMAGNACVVKHASNVSGCALSIEELFQEAGFPKNVYRALLVGGHKDRMDAIIKHPAVQGVSLTGSVEAGRSVAATAGESLKKTVLELGGSDPYIILEDADLIHAAKQCVASRLANSGQSCISAKRFIVVESVCAEFEKRCLHYMQQTKMGDPFLKETEVGPLAKKSLRNDLHRQVEESIAKGAICLLGGNLPPEKGAYYPITLLTGVGKGMPAYHEELFGPVGVIIPVKDRKEAIRVANDSDFGLGASVFTRNEVLGEELACNDLDAGNCFVNCIVRSDPRLPFGGIKASGYGRELSLFGIREFVNIKTVYI